MRETARSALLLLTVVSAAQRAAAQQPVTLAQAIDAALARSPTAALLATDTAAARALVIGARAYPDPTVAAGYSRSTPQIHYDVDVPLDLPWFRGPRVRAAQSAAGAARLTFAAGRAGLRRDVEVAYAGALASDARARLSQRTARDADSLVTIARKRRDAGDASDLDVELAAISAGGLTNDAASDSLLATWLLLDLQRLMGLRADSVVVTLADSLALPADAPAAITGPSLRVAVAEASLLAEEQALTFEHRSIFAIPSLQIGVETHDPSAAEPGLLPKIGIAFPLPLLNRNRGAIALAQASRDRARAQLALERVESDAAVARSVRERRSAVARAGRSGRNVGGADRVAARALTAYTEGAVALAFVLEAQRSAREALARYIDDVASAMIADAEARLATATRPRP